jgi:hypothetical protein
MGQRSAKELESEIKGDKVAFVTSFLNLPATFLVVFVPRIRQYWCIIGYFICLPLIIAVPTISLARRIKKYRQQMAANSNRKIMPIAVGPAVDNEHSVAHALKQSTRRKTSLLLFALGQRVRRDSWISGTVLR